MTPNNDPIAPGVPPTPTEPDVVDALYNALDRVSDGLVNVETQLQQLLARVDAVLKNGIKVHW